jgi:hypothetical protein
MPARGDGITKRKDGRYMGRCVIHNPQAHFLLKCL